jgi:hypothetical protein
VFFHIVAGEGPRKPLFGLGGVFDCPTEYSGRPFAFPCHPLAFNLHEPWTARCVLEKTAVFPVFRVLVFRVPVFRAFARPALHRVAMDLAKLLRELPLVRMLKS